MSRVAVLNKAAPDPGTGSSGERDHELDGLRGLAALIVAFFHFDAVWSACGRPQWVGFLLEKTPLALFVSGNASVILFFILSGFVLALPWVRGRPDGYAVFAVKRICRIWLPYLVALCLSVLGNWKFHGLKGVSSWFELMWGQPVDPGLVLRHVLFLGSYPTESFNGVFWTLRMEMRISLIFPLLCWAVLYFTPGRAILLVGLFLGGALGSLWLIPKGIGFTLLYVGLFLVGILMARHRRQVGAMVTRLPRAAWVPWLLLSLFFYFEVEALVDFGTSEFRIGVAILLAALGGAGSLPWHWGKRAASRGSSAIRSCCF